jgi:FixJ family two-component response regulator
MVHVVDDDASFRAGMGNLLSACGYGVQLHESAEQFLGKASAGEPGCILLDVQMPGLTGPQLQSQLAGIGCSLPIVFLSGHPDIPTSVQTIKAGAEDFLVKPVLKDTLLDAINRALVRHHDALELDKETSRLRERVSHLTPREHDVFALLVLGTPHKKIAHALEISERTVKLHRHNLMLKCGVQSLAELAVIAERLGLITAGGEGRMKTTGEPAAA